MPIHGESIAVNGCCLTIADTSEPGCLIFDVVNQTLAATTLGTLSRGDRVNLEHAVTPTTLMGGHIVQGHIDAVGTVHHVDQSSGAWRVRIDVPRQLMEAIVEKGSIAVDGVSLTVAAAGDTWFDVALIPTTLRDTTLISLTQGMRVNLETDYLAKTVVNWLQRR